MGDVHVGDDQDHEQECESRGGEGWSGTDPFEERDRCSIALAGPLEQENDQCGVNDGVSYYLGLSEHRGRQKENQRDEQGQRALQETDDQQVPQAYLDKGSADEEETRVQSERQLWVHVEQVGTPLRIDDLLERGPAEGEPERRIQRRNTRPPEGRLLRTADGEVVPHPDEEGVIQHVEGPVLGQAHPEQNHYGGSGYRNRRIEEQQEGHQELDPADPLTDRELRHEQRARLPREQQCGAEADPHHQHAVLAACDEPRGDPRVPEGGRQVAIEIDEQGDRGHAQAGESEERWRDRFGQCQRPVGEVELAEPLDVRVERHLSEEPGSGDRA